MIAIVAAAALVAGLLIGLTGIGGVILVPVLTDIAGLPLERAVAACMVGFFFSSALAALIHVRRARLAWPSLAALCAAAAVGAALGAATLDSLPGVGVRLFIAALALASGLQALVAPRAPGAHAPAPWRLALLGLVVGYGSAISGTGGPVLLIPVLLLLRTPVNAAIALGVVSGLPIAFAASAVYAAAGLIDLPLALALAACLVAGVYAGAKLLHRLSSRALTVAVAWTLIGVGLWFGVNSVAPR